MSHQNKTQRRCDRAGCGKIFWRHQDCRSGSLHFCSPECRLIQLRQMEIEAADERFRILNVAYGDGVLSGIFNIRECAATGACREQHYRGLTEGRALARHG